MVLGGGMEVVGWFSPDVLRHVLGREAHDLLGSPGQFKRVAQDLQHHGPNEWLVETRAAKAIMTVGRMFTIKRRAG